MKKIEVLYFLEHQKFERIKWSYFFHFWPPGRDIDNLWFLPVFIFGSNYVSGKSLFTKACNGIFKVKNKYPSDIICFIYLQNDIDFQCIFPYSHSFGPPKSTKLENY